MIIDYLAVHFAEQVVDVHLDDQRVESDAVPSFIRPISELFNQLETCTERKARGAETIESERSEKKGAIALVSIHKLLIATFLVPAALARRCFIARRACSPLLFCCSSMSINVMFSHHFLQVRFIYPFL